MNDDKRKKIGLFAGLVLLIVGLVVGMILIQERQVTKQDADEIPIPLKQIVCSWDPIDGYSGTYVVALVGNDGEFRRTTADSQAGSVIFRDLNPTEIPNPVYCELYPVDFEGDLTCRERSNPITCEAPTGTPVPIPPLPGCGEPCEEDETIPRCADGLQCIYNPNGTKTCQDMDGPTCGPSVTPTATPTVTPSPTPTATPTIAPFPPTVTITPGGPTLTPSPTLTPTLTPSPTPTSVPSPTPTTCPLPNAVQNIALACSTSSAQCTWDASAGANYYLVTIRDKGTGLPIEGYNPNKKVTGTKAEFTAVAGHTYECSVEAVAEGCGGSLPKEANSCLYNPPTTTPQPTSTISPSGSPTPTDIVIVNATNTPRPSQPTNTSHPTLPQTGLGHNSFMIAMIFAVFGIGAVLVGLLIKT